MEGVNLTDYPVIRKQDWLEKLITYLNKAQNKPHKWGKHDCCLFAAGAVKAMTGHDYMKDFRGKYHDKESALGALKTIGRGTLYLTLRNRLGNPIQGFPHRGDVAYHVFKEDGPSVGICIGTECQFVGESGLVAVPVKDVSRFFRIAF